MCLGCKTREQMIARTHAKLAALEVIVDAAHDALRALTIDTAGPTRPATKLRADPTRLTGASPATREEKPAPHTAPAPQRAHRPARQAQLALF
jgi:hypothetical protein